MLKVSVIYRLLHKKSIGEGSSQCNVDFAIQKKTKKYNHSLKEVKRHRCNDCGEAFVAILDTRRMRPAEQVQA